MFIVNEMSRKYEGCLQKNIFVENSSLTGQTKRSEIFHRANVPISF